MTNIIPFPGEQAKEQSQLDEIMSEIRKTFLDTPLDAQEGVHEKTSQKPHSKTSPCANSFTYQGHLSFWRQLFGPFIKELDACDHEKSRIKFKGKYYYFQNPMKSGISRKDIITILQEHAHADPETLVGIDVNKDASTVEITVENENGTQHIHSYPYKPHFPDIDPQIGF